MSVMNKLSTLSSSSVAQLTQTQTGKVEGGSLRQELAEAGKNAPARQAVVHEEDKRKELNGAVKHLSGYVQNITRELNFHLDQASGATVVTVSDEKTGEVIRQIPSEEMLELSRRLEAIKDKNAKGLLFSGDA